MRKYWEKELALCVEGLMINGIVDQQQGRLITNGMKSRSYFISFGDSILQMPEEYLNESILCMTDCRVAVFDPEYTKELFETDLEFVKAVFRQSMCACSHGTLPMLREVGNGDAYAAVRHVCAFCVHHGVPIPTHEQIAMICNRSRPTVTKIMHDLVQREPELFDSGL